MNDRLFHFTVRNDSSGETIQFKGQGANLPDAFKDGYKLMGETFRPKNDGRARESQLCNVSSRDGQLRLKTLKDWENGIGEVAVAEIEIED